MKENNRLLHAIYASMSMTTVMYTISVLNPSPELLHRMIELSGIVSGLLLFALIGIEYHKKQDTVISE